MVVNLTTQAVHADIVHRCLQAGKHVHSEKPLAMTWQEAAGLAKLAKDKGLRLSVCPVTFMGEAQQTLLNTLRQGLAGKIRMIYAEVNWHRLETWHPNPEPFYAIGAHYDVAVYPLRRYYCFPGACRAGAGIRQDAAPGAAHAGWASVHNYHPRFQLGSDQAATGALVRLTSNFYVSWETNRPAVSSSTAMQALYFFPAGSA